MPDKGPVEGVKTEGEIVDQQDAEAAEEARQTIPGGGEVGVKTASDVARQQSPTGPLIRYHGRPPMLDDGVKWGVKGEDEGLVEVVEKTRQESADDSARAQKAGPYAPGQAKPTREPDYLADERTTAPASTEEPATVKELQARAKAAGLTGYSHLRRDELEAAVVSAEATPAPVGGSPDSGDNENAPV